MENAKRFLQSCNQGKVNGHVNFVAMFPQLILTYYQTMNNCIAPPWKFVRQFVLKLNEQTACNADEFL